ncbi:hypothetical protein AMTR_s00009p00268640 [Amborella trichopoda]|uniref:DUF4283 domain-containing protein n=1 Tax=Amborella trichopoda TaxID=13333 RepID=W1NIC8_AMBTC|nr:hypothetical protein AMTR_s00009p00268640 [Amborella trichopoda]
MRGRYLGGARFPRPTPNPFHPSRARQQNPRLHQTSAPSHHHSRQFRHNPHPLASHLQNHSSQSAAQHHHPSISSFDPLPASPTPSSPLPFPQALNSKRDTCGLLNPKVNPSLSNPPPPTPSLSAPFSIPVGGKLFDALILFLRFSLVGWLQPQRNDVAGIQRWALDIWDVAYISCRKLSSGEFLFSFPSETPLLKALDNQGARFKGAYLSLSRWNKVNGAAKPQKLGLIATHIPLQT